MKKYTISNRENSYTLLSVSNKNDVTVARKEFNTPGSYII